MTADLEFEVWSLKFEVWSLKLEVGEGAEDKL